MRKRGEGGREIQMEGGGTEETDGGRDRRDRWREGGGDGEWEIERKEGKEKGRE